MLQYLRFVQPLQRIHVFWAITLSNRITVSKSSEAKCRLHVQASSPSRSRFVWVHIDEVKNMQVL